MTSRLSLPCPVHGVPAGVRCPVQGGDACRARGPRPSGPSGRHTPIPPDLAGHQRAILTACRRRLGGSWRDLALAMGVSPRTLPEYAHGRRRAPAGYLDRAMVSAIIVSSADTCDGAPRVRGTRMRADMLAQLLTAWTREEVLAQYPHLTALDLDAVEAWARIGDGPAP